VFYYGGEDDDDSADGYDDDEDSNAEHHYKNDYPEENLGMGVNELENESTSEDDYFGFCFLYFSYSKLNKILARSLWR
jgi:hypothetical protein